VEGLWLQALLPHAAMPAPQVAESAVVALIRNTASYTTALPLNAVGVRTGGWTSAPSEHLFARTRRGAPRGRQRGQVIIQG
jgi:hypothetical protein